MCREVDEDANPTDFLPSYQVFVVLKLLVANPKSIAERDKIYKQSSISEGKKPL